MKTTLIDIILASWLLILVDSSSYFPSETYISDGLPFQPFIPYFKGHTSKGRFYQTIRVNPEGSEGYGGSESPEGLGGFEYYERPKYPEHHKKGPCSIVNQAMDFCNDVMERLKTVKSLTEKNDMLLAALGVCDKVETPYGTRCAADGNCYVVTEYFDTASNANMYDAWLRACPCPQQHVPIVSEIPSKIVKWISCLGQDSSLYKIVLTVNPANECTYISKNGIIYNSPTANPAPCLAANGPYIFACMLPNTDCPPLPPGV